MKEKALENYKNQQDKLIESLITEIRSNPHFSSTNLIKHGNLVSGSKTFLSKIFKALDADEIPNIPKKTVEPVISLWDHLIKDQIQSGFTTKDLALLIYALKATVSKDDTQNNLDDSEKNKLDNLLDFLGMLTFEMYSIENEKLISTQNKQIQYLQQHESKLSKQLVGSSQSMKQLYKTIGLVLENDLTVLLEGESGTGKDLIATTIHYNSKRQKKPFVAINCGAIPKDLIESELFGHEKGAFTGADQQHIGKFELANGGTLFLDEIGELPLDLQVKLLRILQNKSVERVGGKQSIPINVRIIAATNQNLKKLVDKKKFRLDLYYRLNVFPIHVPPLRERKEDIPLLTHFFIQKYAKELAIKESPITEEALHYLSNQYWEGNIRELENVIQRSLILAQGNPISSTVITMEPGQSQTVLELPAAQSETHKHHQEIVSLEDLEKKAIEDAIFIKEGNMLQIAKALGISRTTLYSKIEKYGIELL